MYRIDRSIPGGFRDSLMVLWEGDDLPAFIGNPQRAYLFDDKAVADQVTHRLAFRFPFTMSGPSSSAQPITYEVVEASEAKLTPDTCGASQLACNIVNNTFLSLDGFAAMRKQMAGTEYTAEHFGAELARIVDRETSELLESCSLIAALPLENFSGCSIGDAIRAARAAIAKATNTAAPQGWESVEA